MVAFFNNAARHRKALIAVFAILCAVWCIVALTVTPNGALATVLRMLLAALLIYLTFCVFTLVFTRAVRKGETALRTACGMLTYLGILSTIVCLFLVKLSVDELSKEGVKLSAFEVFAANGVFIASAVSAALFIAALVLFFVRRSKTI